MIWMGFELDPLYDDRIQFLYKKKKRYYVIIVGFNWLNYQLFFIEE